MIAPAPIAIGYSIRQPRPRDSWFGELLPAEILSLSDCLCPGFPDISAITWVNSTEEERAQALGKIGLARERWEEVRSWATEQFEVSFGWPNWFYSAAAAVEVRQRFFPTGLGLRIVGVALSGEWVDQFIREVTPKPSPPGFGPAGKSGALQVAERGLPLDPGFRPLGYEPLCIDTGELAHSWLCNNPRNHYFQTLGISPNTHGFIATLEEAERCCVEIVQKGFACEPGFWVPVWVVEYGRP